MTARLPNPKPRATALTRLMSLRPRPHFPQREAAFDAALAAGAGSAIVWISDGVQQVGDSERISRFIAAAGNRLDIISMQPSAWLALAGLSQTAEGMEAVIRRSADATEARQGLVRAFDDKGRLLGDTQRSLSQPARRKPRRGWRCRSRS